jgi:hypothetical protein
MGECRKSGMCKHFVKEKNQLLLEIIWDTEKDRFPVKSFNNPSSKVKDCDIPQG